MPTQPPSPTPDETPSNGWDLLDDYQVGKEVADDHEKQSRRFVAPTLPQQTDGVELPPAPLPQAETTSRLTRFWRTDGSAADDASTIAKIMGRREEADTEAQGAIDRAAAANAKDERDRLRERQQREIAEYLALQRSREKTQQQFSNSLQQMMRDVADIFLALGICPDHLEWVPDAGVFCSWGGKVYDHSELFSLRDAKGLPVYSVGPGPDGPSTVCFSPRERRWRLDQPVPPQAYLTPVERLLPVPRRHADGLLRFSAQRARTLLMHEGSMMVYVVNNRVYTTSHLRAAHHLHSHASVLDRITTPAAGTKTGAAKPTRALTDPADLHPTGAMEKVSDAVGSATDSMTRFISTTTRLFRRDRKP